jgi:hypothetical protein
MDAVLLKHCVHRVLLNCPVLALPLEQGDLQLLVLLLKELDV